ncbi:MAG TPA: WXG100 family type VII secretion target [Actinospica sp.]|jgi:WXG100 family type VII secretion target|nr:WXG100 family type VII secretion target [Actinospica sp.]
MDWNINRDIMKVLDMLGLPMPGGNGGVLRQIAQDWSSMADGIEAQVTALNQAVAAVVPADWTGEAADSFHQHWQTQSQQVTTGVGNFRQVADSLKSYADTIDGINEEILSIVEQILAASAAGAILTVVTAGISDAVAAAADAAEALRITELIAKFTELAEQVGVDIERVGEIVEQVVTKLKDMLEFLKSTKYGKIALSVTKDLASNFVADAGANISSQYLSGQKVTLGADLENGALDAAGTVATAGLLGKTPLNLGSMATAGLANVGGGIFQSEAGGLAGVSGDTAFQNPFSGNGLSVDAQNLEGAAADGIGGAAAHDGGTLKNGGVFSITDTLGSLTTGTETSGTSLKQTLSSYEGQDGAIPVGN